MRPWKPVLVEILCSRQLWLVMLAAVLVIFIGMPLLAVVFIYTYTWAPGGHIAWIFAVLGVLGTLVGFYLDLRYHLRLRQIAKTGGKVTFNFWHSLGELLPLQIAVAAGLAIALRASYPEMPADEMARAILRWELLFT
jgi:hypothetical protein